MVTRATIVLLQYTLIRGEGLWKYRCVGWPCDGLVRGTVDHFIWRRDTPGLPDPHALNERLISTTHPQRFRSREIVTLTAAPEAFGATSVTQRKLAQPCSHAA